jgi:transcriptional antiterminator RfaH
MSSNWYLIHSKPKEEYRALDNLENQGFEVFLPLLQSYKLNKGKQTKVVEPLFPRYLFISLDKLSSQWHRIRSTRGVVGLVRFSDMPTAVPDQLVGQIRQLANSEGIMDKTGENQSIYKSGDLVQIIDGSFNGWEAIVKEQDGDQRVHLLLTMLGSEQVIKLPLAAVSPRL